MRRASQREHRWVSLSIPTWFGSIAGGFRCSVCGLKVYYTGILGECPGPRIITSLPELARSL